MMKKKILSAVLCATMLFSAVGFSACEVTDVLFADYKEQIAEMQETLNAQQEKIADFEADVKELQEAINEKEEQIATLEQEKENLQGTIGKLQEEILFLLQGQESVGTEITSDFFGAYSITDESYEAYVRRSAASVGADDKWVSDALKDGQGGNWEIGGHYYRLAYSKDTLNCVFANNQIAVDLEQTTVYNISKRGNIYQGTFGTSTIAFWFNGDRLYLIDEYNKMWVFEKDNSYSFGETVKLESPQDIRVSSSSKYINFEWNYKSTYGTIGATADIKTANSQEYKTINHIDRVWMNSLVSQLERSQFEVGENFVRLYHLGGPKIKNNKTIVVEETSDYVTFRVTIGEDGSVTVMKAYL